jgi:putative glycosyltransferase (TIGR04372 family)
MPHTHRVIHLLRKLRFLLTSFGRGLRLFIIITKISIKALATRQTSTLRLLSDSIHDTTVHWNSKFLLKNTLGQMYGNLNQNYLARNILLSNANWHSQEVSDPKNISYLLEANEIEDKVSQEMGFENLGARFLDSNFTVSIGHMAIALGLRARMARLNEVAPQKFVILTSAVANEYYLKLWQEYFPTLRLSRTQEEVAKEVFWPLFENIETVRRNGSSEHFLPAHNSLARHWFAENRDPILTLPTEEIVKGRELLKSWGLDPEGWFVTLHIRESKTQKPGYGRNSEPLSYMPAIKHIIRMGGSVIRIGGKESTPLERIKGLVDTTQFSTPGDWVDVFLLSQCRFMIATTSGPSFVPQTFGLPILATNAPAIGNFVWYPNSLVIPKLVRDKKGRILSIQEVLDSPAGMSDGWLDGPGSRGIQWVDNSSSEILEGVREMIAGQNLAISKAQENLQQQVVDHGGTSDTTPIAQSFISVHSKVFIT